LDVPRPTDDLGRVASTRAPVTVHLGAEVSPALVDVALDANERLGKQLQTADRRGIPYALVQGPDELTAGEVVVRDLKDGTQHRYATTALVAGLQSLIGARHHATQE
jgi:histidyl-tRNA synthetase